MLNNKDIRIIPARTQIGNTVKPEEEPKLRVAAYCRVSTDSDEQATSYEAQVEHYTNYIKGNDEWKLAGIYADDGITGTNTKKREEFNRMIDDCMAGKIDLIITKSISRFARNTLDCLKYIRQLKEVNIPVLFEKENINSLDSKGEIMLTIMASLAQQESQSLSQNVKLGIQFRYQRGEIQINHNRFLGYTKEDKQLVIVPEEAEIVKRIYREYLGGASLIQIGRGLEADGILTGADKQKWRPETLRKILHNEKYVGDALLQKTYTVDFLTKKRVANNGIVPQYYVSNSHEPIIPRDLFMHVQEEMVRRANIQMDNGKKRAYSGRYALTGVVVCGECGDVYRRVHWNNHGCKSIVWRCVSRLGGRSKETGCSSPTINEITLHDAVVRAINEVLSCDDGLINTVQKNVETVVNEFDGQSVFDIEKKLTELQQELLRLVDDKADYQTVAEEIIRLRNFKNETPGEVVVNSDKQQRVIDMTEFIKNEDIRLKEYDEGLVRRLIEKITVYDGRLMIEFKSGVKTDIAV